MSDLREKVARAIDPAIWSWLPDPSNAAQMEGHAARRRLSLADADAAIAAVLEALKEPSEAMAKAGATITSYDTRREKAVPISGFGEYGAHSIWQAMLTTFTRDHYLSALAEEDGKLIE